jgi:type II secretory pathway pseudopilin PulG
MEAGNTRRLPVRRRSPNPRGFTYIAVLVAMLMLSLATQSVMTYAAQQAQREREAALLRIGQLYAQAIGAYYEATPGSVKRWPRNLEDLLEDRRLVTIKRYIREIYPDPISRSANWDVIVAPDGGIAGVNSPSDARPIRLGGVDLETVTLRPASRYADWQFVYQPTAPMKRP